MNRKKGLFSSENTKKNKGDDLSTVQETTLGHVSF